MKYRANIVSGLVVATLSFGCRTRSVPDEERKSEPHPVSAEDPTKKRAGAPAEAAEARVAAAKALLDAWVKAQNAGDFSAYEVHYAERFSGTKRVATRERRFDRAGWLADRRSMFQKPFSVVVDAVHVDPTGSVVEFTQKFSTATFRDEGKKRLVLTSSAPPRISSEEMLSSRLAAPVEPGVLPTHEEYSPVVDFGGEASLFLGGSVEMNAILPGVRYLDDQHAERTLSTETLPLAWRSLLGKEFHLYGDSGKVCTAKVTGFRLGIDLVPHFGTIEAWNGRDNGRASTHEERALDLWKLSEMGGRRVLARLDVGSNCQSALFARAASLGEPEILEHRSLTPAERVAVRSAARGTSLHRAYQKEFTAAYGLKQPWDETGSSGEDLRAFVSHSGATYFSALLRSGVDDTCSSPFDADLWLLFKKQGDRLELVSGSPNDHVPAAYPRFFEPLKPLAAFDLERDGIIELAAATDFIRHVPGEPGGFVSVLDFSRAYFDCPC